MSAINREWSQVLDSIERTNFKIRSTLAQSLAPLDLTPAEAAILVAVGDADTPPSLKEISRRLVSDTPPSRLAKGLRDRALLKQTRDTEDERIYRFSLTVGGRAAVKKITAARRAMAQKFNRSTSKKDIKAGLRLLGRIEENLSD